MSKISLTYSKFCLVGKEKNVIYNKTIKKNRRRENDMHGYL